MHVYVPPAPRPEVAGLGAARCLVDGLAWLADDGEVTAVAVDADRRLLAVVACGATSGRVLAGDARPVLRPAVALGATAVAVVVLGQVDDHELDRARTELARGAELVELDLMGVVAHERGDPGEVPGPVTLARAEGVVQTSRSSASP